MMRVSNSVQRLHDSVAHAQYVALEEITYEDRDWKLFRETGEDRRVQRKRYHSSDEIVVAAMFTQTWGSTALGFGGIGGAAITVDYTVVLQSAAVNCYLVYFGGRFAYMVSRPNEHFFRDLRDGRMASVADSHNYQNTPIDA